MGVVLRLRDGTVKKYLPDQNESKGKMKCGAQDCEHLGCIIEEKKADAGAMRLIMYTIPVSIIIVLLVLYFFVLDQDTVFIVAGVAAFVVAGDIACFLLFRWIVQTKEDEARELEEFRDRGTVNGIPAEQVHGTPGV